MSHSMNSRFYSTSIVSAGGAGITSSIIDFDQVPYLADSNLTDSNYIPVTIKKAQV